MNPGGTIRHESMSQSTKGADARPKIDVAVIDHGAGNIVSITQGLERVGASAVLATKPEDLAGSDAIVLPGVGSTAAVMAGLRTRGFDEALTGLTVPIFGICVGMQVLFERSDEDGAACLGLIGGVCRRLIGAPRLPHIGWNNVTVVADSALYDGLIDPVVYFVHSFAPEPADPGVVTGVSSHGEPFVASVESGNIGGTQFHPERSGSVGLAMLRNFVRSLDRTRTPR